MVPCILCHGRNGLGQLPGLSSTDNFVGGRWYRSGSPRDILQNFGGGFAAGMAGTGHDLLFWSASDERAIAQRRNNSRAVRRWVRDQTCTNQAQQSYIGGAGEIAGDLISLASLGPGRGAPRTGAAAAQAAQARGGTYILRDPATGRVMRSGRTGDLVQRQSQHAREFPDLRFEVVHRTDVYAQQRGLEQLLHDTHNPPLNRIRPIGPENPGRQEYLDAAREFLLRQQGGN